MSATSELAGRDGYTGAQKFFHWLNAAPVLTALPLGFALHFMPEGAVTDETFDRLYNLHRSFGFLVLAIAVLRVATRILHGAPKDIETLTPFERIASKTTHHLLYVLIFVVPLLGWAGTSAYRAEISVFGLFHLPHFVDENRALSDKLLAAHGVAAMSLAALVALHLAGAAMHAFIKRDGVVSRMLPGR